MNIKKIILTAGILLCLPVSTLGAEIIPEKLFAVAQHEINENTIKSTQEVTLLALDDYSLFDDTLEIKKGEELLFILDEYKPATRGKRNGVYNVTLKHPQPKESGSVLSGTMQVATPTDFKGMAQKLGITVVGKALKVPGFSQAVAAAKGLINPDEEKGRFRSVSRNVYESTPLSLAEKGKEFNIETDGIVVIKLRNQL